MESPEHYCQRCYDLIKHDYPENVFVHHLQEAGIKRGIKVRIKEIKTYHDYEKSRQNSKVYCWFCHFKILPKEKVCNNCNGELFDFREIFKFENLIEFHEKSYMQIKNMIYYFEVDDKPSYNHIGLRFPFNFLLSSQHYKALNSLFSYLVVQHEQEKLCPS